MGKYVFFLDYAVNGCTDEALRDLTVITTVRRLGCYPRIEVPP
jgi:prephenate dehydratase